VVAPTTANAKYGWDREIPGIFFVVDMNKKEIARFSDYGGGPLPPTTSIYDADGGPAIPGNSPFIIAQPNGPSFTIKDGAGDLGELEVPLPARPARWPDRQPGHLQRWRQGPLRAV
jgi:hypothetical protein